MGLEFTGERYVPGTEGIEDLYAEHAARYVAAGKVVGGASVLDVGCGCGYGTSYLASRGASNVLGIDVSPEAVSYAREHYQAAGLDFAVMDAGALALASPFQVVTRVLAEISRVMARRGVLVVSTPNKETYAAGGPGGTNPFHAREYTRAEFEQLLGSVFSRTCLLSQRWCEGLVVEPLAGEPGARPLERHSLPCEGSGTAGRAGAETAYFIAVCGETPDVERVARTVGGLFVDAGSARYRTLKRQAQRVQAEFDKRAAWAARLHDEVETRDAAIRALRADADSLRRAYDDRGKWAQRLERELEALRGGRGTPGGGTHGPVEPRETVKDTR
jgi:SAM-dependent methyltransferase